MSAPCSWACNVSSSASLADGALVQAWITVSGATARASATATSSSALALVHRERPPLADAAGQPQHLVAQIPDAVPDERPVGIPVDVVAVPAP